MILNLLHQNETRTKTETTAQNKQNPFEIKINIFQKLTICFYSVSVSSNYFLFFVILDTVTLFYIYKYYIYILLYLIK
jgi:hypothetical protein